MHTKIVRRRLKGKQMLNIFKILNQTYQDQNYYNFDNVDPQIVRYFRNEFGKSWQQALNNYIEKSRESNDKEAA
tara:strand:+ start:1281 stop:1502 length:222 start_codon:yes stop_codon:yes gene_type:complete